MNNVLEIKDLTVKIGRTIILEKINFELFPSEVIGLLGHNGVGKSTIQRIIANCQIPDSGYVYNRGHKQSIDKSYNNVILVPDNIILLDQLTIIENFDLITKDFNIDYKFFAKFIEVIRLQQTVKVGALSKGNKELVQLLILLSIEGDVYLLDEPFNAIDIFRRDLIQKIIIEVCFRNPQASFIITSHLINEIEPLLTRVLYLNNTALAIDCSLDQILDQAESLHSYLKSTFKEEVGYDYVL